MKKYTKPIVLTLTSIFVIWVSYKFAIAGNDTASMGLQMWFGMWSFATGIAGLVAGIFAAFSFDEITRYNRY